MSLTSRAFAFLQEQYRRILEQMREVAWLEQVSPMLAMVQRVPQGAIAEARVAGRQVSEYSGNGEGRLHDVLQREFRKANSRRKRGHNVRKGRDAMRFDTLEPRMLLSTLYWQGGSGTWDLTSTNHWNTAPDGSGSYVAFSNGDNAVIANGDDFTITMSSSITTIYGNITFDLGPNSVTVSGLTLTGNLTWLSGEITLSSTQISSGNGITLDGGNNTLSLDNATLVAPGWNVSWTSGNVSLANGSQLIAEDGDIYLDGGNNTMTLDNSSLINHSTYYGISWTSGDIMLANGSQLVNYNSGYIYLDGGNNTLSMDNATITNVTGNGYSCYGLLWTGGNIVLANDSHIDYHGTGHIQLNGGNNTLSLDDSTISNDLSALYWSGGEIVITNGSSITAANGLWLQGGNNTLSLDDSTLVAPSWNISWTSGEISLTNGSAIISAAGDLQLDGGNNTMTLDNSSLINHAAYYSIYWTSGDIVLANGSELINVSTGYIWLDGGGNSLTLDNSSFHRDSYVQWSSGTISLRNGAGIVKDISSANQFVIPSSKTVTLDVETGSTIQGSIINNGTLYWTGSDTSQLASIVNNGNGTIIVV